MTQKSARSHRMNLKYTVMATSTLYISAQMDSVCAEKFHHINKLATDSKTKLINLTKLNEAIPYLLTSKTIFP
jgi:hypothetical protein